MAFAIAGLFADGETIVQDAECVEISYPGFKGALEQLPLRFSEVPVLSDAGLVYARAGKRDDALREVERLERRELEGYGMSYEIAIIQAYLPQQLSDIEAGEAISSLIKELEAATLKDMGRTMTALKERFAGRMDFAKASSMVKKLLAG